MNNLLISEPPLQVLPSLAVKVGLNEAIILQQFHYWLQRSSNVRDGYKWIYNSITEWQKQFPFWSKETVKRAINSLEKQGCLVVGNYNKAKFDKTKWYRINYEWLTQPLGQNDPTSGSNRPNGEGQNDPTNTNRLPETTTEITKRHSPAKAEPRVTLTDYQVIIDDLNRKAGTNYRPTGKKTQRLIHARFEEGFKANDFKTVIDNKVAEWKGTEMAKYLRPETLFGTKFEAYLNQKAASKQQPQERFYE